MNLSTLHDAVAALAVAPATNVAGDLAAWRLAPSGWVMMLASIAFVVGLFGWCLSRVMRENPDKLHAPIEAELRRTE